MKIETIPLLSDNYAYLLICTASGQAAVVDPAEAEPVLARVRELGVDLVAIWNTHHHWDHTGGNEAILKRGQVEVYGHRSDSSRIAGFSSGLDHGDTVVLGQLRATVLHTPGHTRGALVYVVQDAALTGDTLFGAGCGRLFEGDPPTMHDSLNQRIAKLPADTRVFCGHEYTEKNLAFAVTLEPGNHALQQRVERVSGLRADHRPSVPSTLGEELATNPFLRCQQASLRSALAARFPERDLSEPSAVFALLRQLRDRF